MKYTPEIIARIVEKLEAGEGRVNACKHAGIHYSTLLDWISNKSDFSETVKKAEITGLDQTKDEAISAIKAKFKDQWQAAAWWLERNHPEQFRNKSETEHSFKGSALKIGFDDSDKDQA